MLFIDDCMLHGKTQSTLTFWKRDGIFIFLRSEASLIFWYTLYDFSEHRFSRKISKMNIYAIILLEPPVGKIDHWRPEWNSYWLICWLNQRPIILGLWLNFNSPSLYDKWTIVAGWVKHMADKRGKVVKMKS